MAVIPEFAPGVEIAEACGFSDRWLRKLVADGRVPKPDRGRGFDVKATLRAVLEVARSVREPDALAAAKAAREAAKTRILQLEIQRAEGRLIDLDEHLSIVDELVGLFLVALSTLPARIARMDMKERRRIETICDQIRDELATKAAQKSAELGGGRP